MKSKNAIYAIIKVIQVYAIPLKYISENIGTNEFSINPEVKIDIERTASCVS